MLPCPPRNERRCNANGSRPVNAGKPSAYATADAIAQATDQPAIITFTAANMIRVARLWNHVRPDLDYVIFADDDAATAAKPNGKNVGIEAAEAAALEIGARIAKPYGRAA